MCTQVRETQSWWGKWQFVRVEQKLEEKDGCHELLVQNRQVLRTYSGREHVESNLGWRCSFLGFFLYYAFLKTTSCVVDVVVHILANELHVDFTSGPDVNDLPCLSWSRWTADWRKLLSQLERLMSHGQNSPSAPFLLCKNTTVSNWSWSFASFSKHIRHLAAAVMHRTDYQQASSVTSSSKPSNGFRHCFHKILQLQRSVQ